MSLFKRNGAGHNGNTPALVATPPFAHASEPLTPDEHREVAARAYIMWRRYLAELNRNPNRKYANMPSAEADIPQARKPKPAKPKRLPARGTAAWRKEMYRRVAEQKRAEKRLRTAARKASGR